MQKVSSFDFNGSKLWSFTLHGTRGFFRTGKAHPGVEPNQLISFDGQADGKGNVKVEPSTITLSKQSEASGVSNAITSSAGVPDQVLDPRDDRRYETKFDKDNRNARIELQSCRNSALELVGLILQHGELKVGAKVDKVVLIEEMVDRYTDKYVAANSGEKTAVEAP